MNRMYDVECNGKHYVLKTLLTVDEITAIWKSAKGHAAILAEELKDPVKYHAFAERQELQWNILVAATLKKCLGVSKEEVGRMSYLEARALFQALVTLDANITKIVDDKDLVQARIDHIRNQKAELLKDRDVCAGKGQTELVKMIDDFVKAESARECS